MCSIIGLLASGTIGLGMLLVKGRRRVPNPPAITTAFMARNFRAKGWLLLENVRQFS
jgi:hypothetical protein